MITNETQVRQQSVMDAARMMMAAARTAPKAKGVDLLEIVAVTGDDLARLASKMRELSGEFGLKFFLRDALNVEAAHAVVLIGTRQKTQSLNCGYCGHATCEAKNANPDAPCYFNTVDIGIAVGSAVSVAADLRMDTRVMYSAGVSARRLGLISDCEGVLAILMSCGSKNPFFDRPSQQ